MSRTDATGSFGLSGDSPVVVALGGSQGSRTINRLISASLDYLIHQVGTQIIWQTGSTDYDLFRHFESTYSPLRLFPFLDEIGPAYAAADLVVSRAGALTLAEICWCGKPSILIPFAGAAADHQMKNAKTLEEAGASVLLTEKDLTHEQLGQEIESLLSNPERLSQMGMAAKSISRPDAAEQIVDHVVSLAER